MFQPDRAVVKPRVFSQGSSEALPLEDEMQALLASGARGVVYLVGGSGSGKTTALQHLAAVLPAEWPVEFWDDANLVFGNGSPGKCILIRALSTPGNGPAIACYRLAPWSDDDLIEYLLATHRNHCGSIMSRVNARDRNLIQGIPELWRVALDLLANDPSISHATDALNHYLQAEIAEGGLRELVYAGCLAAMLAADGHLLLLSKALPETGLSPTVRRILRHPQVQLLLAAQRAAIDIRAQAECSWLATRLSRELVDAVASEINGDKAALTHLRNLTAMPAKSHAMAASLLLAADPVWIPISEQVPVLAGAYLTNARWPGVQLPSADLRGADFSHADLSGANLEGADAFQADFHGACLRSANLTGLCAVEAEFEGADLCSILGTGSRWFSANLKDADLSNANLGGASFEGANCAGTVFVGANLAKATFSAVDLAAADFSDAALAGATLTNLCLRETRFSGACLAGAKLGGSDLEGMNLTGVNLQNADLTSALLTGSVLSKADLRGASLSNSGLGDIDLEQACLTGADLRGATFHMGSTRSGLLFTPIASEGTRTGFYTDDADEQYFKSPEEIRKANLCGADLLGAKIDGVDFYLVDLRGALYDVEQAKHFRRCRAILENRTD